jgi:hypothetical protein
MIPALMIYSAERTRTSAEQRETDLQTSELAAAVAQFGISIVSPFRALGRLARALLGRADARKVVPYH